MSRKKPLSDDEYTRQTAAAVLVDIMEIQDVDGSLPCPIALWTLVHTLLETWSSSSPEDNLNGRSHARVMRCYPDVVRRMLNFLVRPRTADARLTLAALPILEIPHCNCAKNRTLWSNSLVREVHDPNGLSQYRPVSDRFPGLSALQCVLFAMTSFVGSCIHIALTNPSRSRLLNRACDAMQRGRMLPWPSCLGDVLPYGLKDSISALCAWTEYLPDMLLLGIDMTYKTVISSACPWILLETIIPTAYMRIASEYVTTANTVSPSQCSPSDLHVLGSITGHLSCLSSRQLREVLKGQIDCLRPLVDIFRRCVDIGSELRRDTSAPPDEDLPQHIQYFSRMAERLAALLGSPAGEPLPPEAAITSIAQYFPFLRRGIICARPGCERTRFAVGRSLRACGGCGSIHYCSSICQKAAWRHNVLPHKAVCWTLHTLSNIFLVSTDWDVAENRERFVAVLAECPVDIVAHLDGLYMKEYT